MKSQWNFAPLGIGLWLAAISAFGQTAGSAGTSTFSIYLRPIGLAATETAQVNVVNAAQLSTLPGWGHCVAARSRFTVARTVIPFLER